MWADRPERRDLAAWSADPAGLDRPAAAPRVAMLDGLGRFLEDHPDGDARALGFWLRPQRVCALAARAARAEPGIRRFARGTTVHFLPGNTPFLGVYTWALSFLCGNRTALRLSSRTPERESQVWAWLLDLLAGDGPEAAASTTVVRCPPDDPRVAELSALADVRLIWGADTTVRAVTALPSSPSTRDLVFGERHSLAAFDARAVLGATPSELARLAATLVRDVAWSLHQACTAPRVLVWSGSGEDCVAAQELFGMALGAVENPLRHDLTDGGHLERLTWAQLSVAVGSAQRYRTLGNGLTLLDGAAAPRTDGTWPAGLLEVRTVARLTDLAPALTAAHQTLAVFGFGPPDIDGFADRLGPGTVRRIVPVGDSHRFDVVWDGYDLIDELTTKVTVPGHG